MREAAFLYPPMAEAAFDVRSPRGCYDAAMSESTKPPGAERTDPADTGRHDVFRVVIEPDGRVMLPAAVRERLGVAAGDYLVLKTQRDGSATMISLAQVVDQARGHFSDVAPGRSLADDLIAERREEARRESEG